MSDAFNLNEICKSGFEHVLELIDPGSLIKSTLNVKNCYLQVHNHFDSKVIELDMRNLPNILILGAGKASQKLLKGTLQVFDQLHLNVPNLHIDVFLNYPKGQNKLDFTQYSNYVSSINLNASSHPIPDQSTIDATDLQLKAIQNARKDTLILVLMSGGGSSLLETIDMSNYLHSNCDIKLNNNNNNNNNLDNNNNNNNLDNNNNSNSINNTNSIFNNYICNNKKNFPKEFKSFDYNPIQDSYFLPKITLSDIQIINQILIDSGADIVEINTIRKHFSSVKGGKLAQIALKNPNISLILGLYLSDVIGNELTNIASGPTVADPTTFQDCLDIIKKYKINFPESIRNFFDVGKNFSLLETPKLSDPLFERVINVLLASADHSASIAKAYLVKRGIKYIEIFSNNLQGEAKEFGINLPSIIDSVLIPRVPSDLKNNLLAFLGTGEFTVTIKGKGRGGRNQEMLLAFLYQLSKHDSILKDYKFTVMSCALDGIEGNSPATGGIIDDSSLERLKESLGLKNQDVESYLIEKLNDNDSYTVFEKLNNAIVIGHTGINLSDLFMILILPKVR